MAFGTCVSVQAFGRGGGAYIYMLSIKDTSSISECVFEFCCKPDRD